MIKAKLTMKKYWIKYEDYDGNIYCLRVEGFSKQDIIRRLVLCKKVYWIK